MKICLWKESIYILIEIREKYIITSSLGKIYAMNK